MKLVLEPGDKLEVVLKDCDGEFVFEWGKNALRITADLNDTSGRGGVIYEEVFGRPDPREKNGDAKVVRSRQVRKLEASVPAKTFYKNFVVAAMAMARTPDAIGTHGNLPDLGTFAAERANTIVVLFEGRLSNSGLLHSVAHTFVKSGGYWWPQPEKEPHNCWSNSQLEQFIATHDYGYAIFRFGDGKAKKKS